MTPTGSFESGLREIIAAEVRAAVASLRDGIRADFRAELEAERAARPPERLDVDRAAERLGVSVATVRRRIKDGALPSFRLGRRVLVELSATRTVGEITEASRRAVAEGRRGLVSVPKGAADR